LFCAGLSIFKKPSEGEILPFFLSFSVVKEDFTGFALSCIESCYQKEREGGGA